MTYAFSRMVPPLMKDDGDILSLPAQALKSNIGTATWKKATTQTNGAFGEYLEWRYTYTLHRHMMWKILSGPIRWATDTRYVQRVIEVTSKTAKKSFEQTLDASITGSFGGKDSLVHLDGSVKATLKITDATELTWSTTNDQTKERTLMAGITYIDWVLLDVYDLAQTRKTYDRLRGSPNFERLKETINRKATIYSVLNQFEDSCNLQPDEPLILRKDIPDHLSVANMTI